MYRSPGSSISPRMGSEKKQNGCLRKPYKKRKEEKLRKEKKLKAKKRKEEKLKAKKKRKYITI